MNKESSILQVQEQAISQEVHALQATLEQKEHERHMLKLHHNYLIEELGLWIKEKQGSESEKDETKATVSTNSENLDPKAASQESLNGSFSSSSTETK